MKKGMRALFFMTGFFLTAAGAFGAYGRNDIQEMMMHVCLGTYFWDDAWKGW
jgi:hypothetical protein